MCLFFFYVPSMRGLVVRWWCPLTRCLSLRLVCEKGGLPPPPLQTRNIASAHPFVWHLARAPRHRGHTPKKPRQ